MLSIFHQLLKDSTKSDSLILSPTNTPEVQLVAPREEKAKPTPQALKDALILLESAKPAQELQLAVSRN